MIDNTEQYVIGYAGKKYSIEELKIKAKEYVYGDNSSVRPLFERIYNNPSEEDLDGEVWVRLSQDGWSNYLVSNKGRVRWQKENEKPILLNQVDEIKDGKTHNGYLVFDPNQLPRQIQHNYHVWRLVAMAFLGLKKYDSRVVHHINNNGYDCRPENLILVSWKQHSAIHNFYCGKKDQTI